MVGQRSEPRLQLLLAAALVAAAAFVAQVFVHEDSAPVPVPRVDRSERPAPAAGPSARRDAAASAPADAPAIDVFATDDGELVVDAGLLRAMDVFLVERAQSGGAAALRQFLKGRLPPAAGRQAERLAEAYGRYIAVYDDVLAAQNLHTRGTPLEAVDLRRIASWAVQRQRLRQQFFGEDVARRWFENDDARLAAVIDALGQPSGQDPAAPDPRYAPSQELLRREQAQHALYLKQVLDDATTGFRERARR